MRVRRYLHRRCRFRVETTLPTAAWFRLLDRAGKTLQVHRFEAGGHESRELVRLRDGRSPNLCSSREARTLVVLDGSRSEIARVSIRVEPGRLKVIGR